MAFNGDGSYERMRKPKPVSDRSDTYLETSPQVKVWVPRTLVFHVPKRIDLLTFCFPNLVHVQSRYQPINLHLAPNKD